MTQQLSEQITKAFTLVGELVSRHYRTPAKSSASPLLHCLRTLAQTYPIAPESDIYPTERCLIVAHPNQDDDLPPLGEIYETWLTTAEAGEIIGMTQSAVIAAVKRGTLRGVKLGPKRRGQWRIAPVSARRYIRQKPSG